MAGYGPQIAPRDHPVFDYAVGGELPLSPEEACNWLTPTKDDQDRTAIERVCGLFGGEAENALWLRFGRSGFEVVFDLIGAGPESRVAMPAYHCREVFDKIRAKSGKLLYYQLETGLAPDAESLLDVAGESDIVVTCAYFGSAGIDDRLATLGPRLRALANAPWVIEDRAMAFPAPVPASDSESRCDFALYSLRKSYPVPDGAPLVACSARARDAFRAWRTAVSAPAEAEEPLRIKVRAKVKRHQWLTEQPLVDSPDLNGLNESESSESAINVMEAERPAEELGSVASATYILDRNLDLDARTVRERARAVVEALQQGLDATFPLHDCTGIAVPMLLNGRARFLDKGRTRGMFLPVHWPRDDVVPAGAHVAHWYDSEVSLPTLPTRPPKDIEYLIERLSARL